MSHDKLTPEERSHHMARIHSKDTKPEIRVRKLIFYLGYRYRLRINSLPGKPDIVFISRRKVIFVHGCFWHGHNCPSGRNKPNSNLDYWLPKLKRNKQRDKQHLQELKKQGWESLVIWECQTKKDIQKLIPVIRKFLDD